MSDDAQRRARESALGLLARREHSRAELARKLEARDYVDADIAAVLDALTDAGLLSETRFAEAFVTARVRKGQGPRRIRAELRQRGVTDEMIDRAFDEAAVDWLELAQRVHRRRFGDQPPADVRDRARRVRFLEYRGFGADEIYAVVPDCADSSRSA